MKQTIAFCFAVLIIIISSTAFAQVSLPKIFSDNMVLQRNQSLSIWGWASAGESIAVSINGQRLQITANAGGDWQVLLKPMVHGGPFELRVKGKNEVVLRNILVGDVWFCSGQSNMEWVVKNGKNSATEIAAANYPTIRYITVEKAVSFRPQRNIAGGTWQVCSPVTVGEFSAVGYFFARQLTKDLDVPIGLINSSWGGTNIQTWTSWDTMHKDPAWRNANLAEREAAKANMQQNISRFRTAVQNDKGLSEGWYKTETSTADWKTISLPKIWEQTEIGNADGNIWFRKEFELDNSWDGKPVQLNLGPIDDIDLTYVNGKQVGGLQQHDAVRSYTVDAAILQKGKNTIAVKVTDNGGGGGLYGQPEQLYVETAGKKLSLAGPWQYKSSALTTDFGITDVGPNSFPSQLYNAMVAPVIRFGIKGAIWYQGEANTFEAVKYQQLFPQLIQDWRIKWGYAFPFLWAQLANFMQPAKTPASSEWAELREAQTKTLSVPKTGQAILIDIGEAGDIHPRNKQDVGYRLALAAEKVAYNKSLVYSGPTYSSMQKANGRITLRFQNTGGGLMVKGANGQLKGFAIAGQDQKFVWAKATIQGDKVVVYHELVPNPVAVRYAWGDNPDDANLYNKEGLPAGPFRTDTWPEITRGKAN